MLLNYAVKLFWWALPKLIGGVIDKLGDSLALVEQADGEDYNGAKRLFVIEQVQQFLPGLPESIIRAYVEILVILYSVGVTSEALNTMEKVVGDIDVVGVSPEAKRAYVLSSFSALFPGVPERVGRLLIKLAVARLRSKGAEV